MKKNFFIFILFFISSRSFSQNYLFDSLYVKDSRLHWKYIGKLKVDTFFVQQLRWSKWALMEFVKCDSSKMRYDCCAHLHSGENDFRVTFKLKPGKNIVYQEMKYSNPSDTIYYTHPEGKGDSVYFLKPGKWEIYDKFGNIVKKGEGDRFGIKDLIPDVYYLNYNNRTMEFIRAKKGKVLFKHYEM